MSPYSKYYIHSLVIICNGNVRSLLKMYVDYILAYEKSIKQMPKFAMFITTVYVLFFDQEVSVWKVIIQE